MRRQRFRTTLALALLLGLVGSGNSASGAVFTWTGDALTSGWYDTRQIQGYPLPDLYINNWGRIGPPYDYGVFWPTVTDDAVIGAYAATLNMGGGGITDIKSLSIEAGGSLTTADTRTQMIRVLADCLLDGEFRFGAPSYATGFAFDTNVNVTGSGAFVFATTPGLGDNSLSRSNDLAAVLTLGSKITVRTDGAAGTGYIDVTLVNHGTIDADGGFIRLWKTAKTSDGLIRARNGGTIMLETATTNTGGAIRVGSGSTLDLYMLAPGHTHGWVVGGTIEGDGGAGGDVTITNAGELDGVTLNAVTVQVSNGDDLYLSNHPINNAIIRLADTDAFYGAAIRIRDDLTLGGTGTVLVDSPHQNYITDTGYSPAKTLTLGSDQTLRVSAGSWVQVQTQLTNHGTIQADGELEIYISRTLTNSADGRLTGSGKIELLSGAVLVNDGTTAPGNSAGILEFVGNFNQSATAVLEMDIAGYLVGDEYDRLSVTGSATLAGLLDIALDTGFHPRLGDTFDLLTTTGTLSNNGLTLSPADTSAWQLNWSAHALQIEYVVPEPATMALLALGGLGVLLRRKRK